MGKPISETFQRIYKLYASDLSITEIERLVKRDAPGIYDYYLREAQKVDQQKNPVERTIRLVGNLFEAFLRKLSPSRRLFYSLILFLFIYSVVGASWFWAIGSFVLLNVLLAFELADKLIAKDELEVARDIQMNLMPQQPPAHPNLNSNDGFFPRGWRRLFRFHPPEIGKRRKLRNGGRCFRKRDGCRIAHGSGSGAVAQFDRTI
ncbi:MAG: hypothetical protein R3C26_10390 [Calditrichia bacterium]